MTASLSTEVAARVFGRRAELPQPSAQPGLHPSPAQLAYALRNEGEKSLRRLVLERLYERLTHAEKRLCDAERCRLAIA